MPIRYTPEQHVWLEKHYADMTNEELADAFRELFCRQVTEASMFAYGKNHHLRKSAETRSRIISIHARRKYTDDENDFLREYIPGHSESEIIAAFAERFGRTLNRSQVRNRKTKLGVPSGTHGGRFVSGMTPANKGKSWSEYMPEDSIRRVRESGALFKKGNTPPNAYHQLLDERKDMMGTWVYVKPRNAKYTTDFWITKQRFVWMQANGRDWPEGCRAVCADHDRDNFDPENVVPVPNDLYGIVTGGFNGKSIPYHDRASLETAILHARVVRERRKLQLSPTTCGACGQTFTRRYEHQRTCDTCLKLGKRAPKQMKKKGE
jgi:hypothetical protein